MITALITGGAIALLASYMTHRLANKRAHAERVREQGLRIVYDFIKAVSRLKYLAVASGRKSDRTEFIESAAEMDAAGELLHVFYDVGLVEVATILSKTTKRIESAHLSGDKQQQHAALAEYRHTMEMFVSHAHTSMGVREVYKGNLHHRIITFPEAARNKMREIWDWIKYQVNPM